jgi:hypothetical protein
MLVAPYDIPQVVDDPDAVRISVKSDPGVGSGFFDFCYSGF